MDLAKYLENKKKQAEDKVKEESLYRFPCLKCFRPKKNCLCSDIKPFETKSLFVILIHPMEAKKEKIATGRLSHLCLKRSKLIVGLDFSDNKEVNQIINDEDLYPYLLYPGIESHNITKNKLEILTNQKDAKGKRAVFFIIDATWPHAKSMMKKSHNLHALKRVSFEYSGKSKFIIKQQPNENCLCTIESLYYLIDGLNSHGHEKLNNEHLLLLNKLDDLVKFQIECTMNPDLKSYRKGNFKKPEERPYSKKWDGRSVCYEDKNHKN